MSYILALDQGTTSSRAVIFDASQAVKSVAQFEFTQHFPQPGWVEHDADEIWQTQLRAARDALSAAGLSMRDIAAIGITNQRETTVLWDRRTGQPIHNAIVWQDRRTTAVCDRLREAGHEGLVYERTGLLLDPYFSATKIAWILDHVDGARAAADAGHLAFGTVDSWLVWNLTEGATHLSEPSNASRTSLYDIRRGDWDDDLLEIFQVPRSVLPSLGDSSGVLAEARLDGSAPVMIGGIAGDQQAALFGQACFAAGDAKCTYGTGCFLLMNTGTKVVQSQAKLLSTVAWSIDGVREYALEGSLFMGGAVVQWLRDNLRLIENAADVEALAASVDDSGGVILVPAFAGLGAPHWDASARGSIQGLTRGTTAAHIARAALEGIAFQVADVIAAMESDAGRPVSEIRVDGGAAANNLLMQMQANTTQRSILRAANLESTALGAAALAGLGVGLWSGKEELRAFWGQDRAFTPQADAESLQQLRARWLKAVQRSLHWENDQAE